MEQQQSPRKMLTPDDVLALEKSLVDEERRNFELSVAVDANRANDRTRLVTIAVGFGAILVPVLSAVDAGIPRHVLRDVIVALAASVTTVLLFHVAENLAGMRTARRASVRLRVTFDRLLKWKVVGSVEPPDAETKAFQEANTAFYEAFHLEQDLYRIGDIVSIGLICFAMIRLSIGFVLGW